MLSLADAYNKHSYFKAGEQPQPYNAVQFLAGWQAPDALQVLRSCFRGITKVFQEKRVKVMAMDNVPKTSDQVSEKQQLADVTTAAGDRGREQVANTSPDEKREIFEKYVAQMDVPQPITGPDPVRDARVVGSATSVVAHGSTTETGIVGTVDTHPLTTVGIDTKMAVVGRVDSDAPTGQPQTDESNAGVGDPSALVQAKDPSGEPFDTGAVSEVAPPPQAPAKESENLVARANGDSEQRDPLERISKATV